MKTGLAFKKSKIYVLACFLLLNSCIWNKNEERKIRNEKITQIVDQVKEVDTKFLVTNDFNLLFSKYDSGFFNIYSYNFGSNTKPVRRTKNTDNFNPILIKNEINSLSDKDGDQNFKLTVLPKDMYSLSYTFQWIYSSGTGNLQIFKLQQDNSLYFLNSETRVNSRITTIQNKFHGFCFSKDETKILLSYDGILSYYDILTSTEKILLSEPENEKLNPYLYDNAAYFASNRQSNYFQIYTISLNSQAGSASQLVYRTNHDIRLPKRNGNYLYFIEILRSEYLLKRLDLRNGQIDILINQGVVYDYDFLGKNLIALTYSDFKTPRSMMCYNTTSKKLVNVSSNSLNLGLTSSFINDSGLCPTYIFNPSKDTELKGVILFFHPGLNSDFSPRWDTLLMTLCKLGYIIVNPNYSMSSGYGKIHQSRSFDQATINMIDWSTKLKIEFPQLPLYYISSSSGNILMENTLSSTSKSISAAASLFGISHGLTPPRDLPILYILGKNDPAFDVAQRFRELLLTNVEKNDVVMFRNEGHWLRRKENTILVIDKIISFFEKRI